MQVKDGSWYQAADKAIRRAGVCTDKRYAHIFSQDGTFANTVFADSGRFTSPKDGSGDLIREVSGPTKPLQLRVGGKYLDSEGTEVGPLQRANRETYPFFGMHGSVQRSWMPDGTHSDGFQKYCDLICEILDQPEPELVLEAGKYYETREGGIKGYCIGENPFAEGDTRAMAVSIGQCVLVRHKNGRVILDRDSHGDFIRPWIDPPTEFVDPRTGKRYRVGEEIK